jgi:glycosyltransferase involved in cell wall biosynthesis
MRRKVRQLTWLFNGIDPNNMDWKLIFVDDGCPNNSGKIAQKLVDDDKTFFTDNIRKRVSINFLSEGIKKIDKFINDPNLNNTNDSRKGGAVQYGMFLALADNSDLIMYTDADLSANISQSGLLLADITLNNVDNRRKAVIANRYTKGIFSNSEVMGTFKTNKVALRFRAFYRGFLLPPFKDIYDTQCGFKVFRNECIAKVLPKLTDYKGMFDMELLIKVFTVYATGNVDDDPSQLIYSTGVVWLHSAAETQFGSFTQSHFAIDYGWKHYNQLQQIIDIHKKTYANSPLCDPIWLKFIFALKWKEYFQICQIAYLTGIDVYNWFPTLKELQDMIAQDYPANAPAFIENPGKK